MSDDTKVKTAGDVSADERDVVVSTPYVPPRLTKVGNIRDLLAGNGGTQPDADPTAIDLQLT
jgi:hypothetical protein